MIDQTIAHYKVTAKLGEGGMGEVYRATDTKLSREVAIKVIPESFAQDPDRMTRFAREAQVLASLNHPNIAAIYGVEDLALVMELVEGPTLAERIAQGPMTVEEALPILNQIIDGFEYAHEKGIVHRDLKPANIKITGPASGYPGRVKILDFGLAKALASESQAGDPGASPTLTMRATMAGMIMGTAAYMAPEQARGHDVDKRADIWAFGVVAYEMLTGRQLFIGPTVSDTLASVLKEQPDWERIPAKLRRLLRLCLAKDPRQRLRDIGDARALIDEPAAPLAPAESAPRRGVPTWAAAALALAVLLLAFFLWRAFRPVDRPMMRFSADLGPEAVRGLQLTAVISPDGTRLVFLAHGAGGATELATRLLDQSKANVLAGTENAVNPFFSPDGQWIGFFADQKMKKISVQGGAAVTLCDTTAPARGAAWGEDGNIIASLDQLHLFRVPAAGGKPEMLAKPEDHGERTWRWPQILPGGQTLLFTGGTIGIGGYENANIEVLSLKTGQPKIVQRGGYFGRYLPSGHLVYVHQGTLFAIPFDLARLETRGMPAPVLEDVAAAAGQAAGQLDFSQTGTFVYLSGKSASSGAWALAWMDSTGKTQPLWTAPAAAVTPSLSPDGKRLAVSINQDISVYDLQRGATTQLTFSGALNRYPLWMPDGKHIIFGQGNASGEYGIWWIRADGSGQPEKLFGDKAALFPTSLSPGGRRVAFLLQSPETGMDLWTLPLDLSDPDHPKPGKPELFLREPGDQSDAAFSPDGRWMAYTSFQTGSGQVFVRPFPASPSGGRWLISTEPGRFPAWSRNGRELFYLNAADSHLMLAGYTAKGDSFAADKPRQWSPSPIYRTGNLWPFDLAPDGKRIVVFPLAETPTGDDKATVHVTVLLNFFDELRRRMPPH